MIESILLFLFGSLIGHVLPRFPVLLLSRGRGFNLHFPPHPEPMPLGRMVDERDKVRANEWLEWYEKSSRSFEAIWVNQGDFEM